MIKIATYLFLALLSICFCKAQILDKRIVGLWKSYQVDDNGSTTKYFTFSANGTGIFKEVTKRMVGEKQTTILTFEEIIPFKFTVNNQVLFIEFGKVSFKSSHPELTEINEMYQNNAEQAWEYKKIRAVFRFPTLNRMWMGDDESISYNESNRIEFTRQ